MRRWLLPACAALLAVALIRRRGGVDLFLAGDKRLWLPLVGRRERELAELVDGLVAVERGR